MHRLTDFLHLQELFSNCAILLESGKHSASSVAHTSGDEADLNLRRRRSILTTAVVEPFVRCYTDLLHTHTHTHSYAYNYTTREHSFYMDLRVSGRLLSGEPNRSRFLSPYGSLVV